MVSSVPALSKIITLEFATEEVIVHIETAMPVGLVMNELIANSLTFSKNVSDSDKIFISIKRLQDRTVEICYKDNLSPGFESRNKASLGLKNAILLVEMQLKGQIDFDKGNGLSCNIRFKDNLYRYKKEIQ